MCDEQLHCPCKQRDYVSGPSSSFVEPNTGLGLSQTFDWRNSVGFFIGWDLHGLLTVHANVAHEMFCCRAL